MWCVCVWCVCVWCVCVWCVGQSRIQIYSLFHTPTHRHTHTPTHTLKSTYLSLSLSLSLCLSHTHSLSVSLSLTLSRSLSPLSNHNTYHTTRVTFPQICHRTPRHSAPPLPQAFEEPFGERTAARPRHNGNRCSPLC